MPHNSILITILLIHKRPKLVRGNMNNNTELMNNALSIYIELLNPKRQITLLSQSPKILINYERV